MMRKILLALALASLATPVWAVCPSPLTGKDGSGNPQNFGVTVDASGNCYGNVGIVDGTNAANKAAVSAAGAVKVDASASTQPVSGTLAATQSGTWTVQPGNTANTTPWATNVTQLGGNAINLGAGATGTGTPRVTQASDSPEIAVLGVLNAAAGCGTTNTLWQCIFQLDNDVKAGTGATGSSVPATALYPGLRGQNAEQTAVTNGQLVGQASDLTGKAIVLPYANPENGLNGEITAAMTGTSSTAVTGMGAQGAGVRNYVTACTFSNSHATVGTMMLLQDGSGGTTIWQAPAAAGFNGAVVQFPTPIKTTANTGLFAQNVTTGSNTFVSCTGYKGI